MPQSKEREGLSYSCFVLQHNLGVTSGHLLMLFPLLGSPATPLAQLVSHPYLHHPGSSAGKEFVCNAGDTGSIPGLGRFTWRRDKVFTPVFLGFPGGSDGKESSWNARDWIQSLGWEDPLEEGMATHTSILAWRIPMDRGVWWATVHVVTENQT